MKERVKIIVSGSAFIQSAINKAIDDIDGEFVSVKVANGDRYTQMMATIVFRPKPVLSDREGKNH